MTEERKGILHEILALLNAEDGTGIKIFKSWNRYSYSNSSATSVDTFQIDEVDPDKCIVFVERLHNDGSILYYYDYTLAAASITVRHVNYNSAGIIRLAFTVLELY